MAFVRICNLVFFILMHEKNVLLYWGKRCDIIKMRIYAMSADYVERKGVIRGNNKKNRTTFAHA